MNKNNNNKKARQRKNNKGTSDRKTQTINEERI